jgi:hypothetical protein
MGKATLWFDLWQVRSSMAIALCMAMVIACQTGCKKSSSIPSIPALPRNDTPEGKLARVMQRLDSAIGTARAASGSGVVSERRAHHELTPPPTKSGLPEAVVFIETRRALAPKALNQSVQDKLQAEAEKRGEELSEDPMKPLVVEDEEQVEVEKFPLIYDGQRWKLVTELKPTTEEGAPSTEYILFDYALDAN